MSQSSSVFSPESILGKIPKDKIDQAEVYLSKTTSLRIDVLDQQVESIDELSDRGLAIRVIKDNKLGFAFTSDFDEDVIEQTIEQATANAKSADADEFMGLPDSSQVASGTGSTGLYDQNIDKTSTEDKIKLALAVEKAAYKVDARIKKTEKVNYSDHESEIWIVNSNGLNINYKSNYCGADAEVIAIQDQEMQMGFGLNFAQKIKNINPAEIGQEAAQKALEQLGAKEITSQKLTLVLSPFVGTQLLGVLASMLSSDSAQKGKSLFAGKIGQIVAAKGLNIIDNGNLAGGLASAPFDAEGVSTQETKLIETGILRNFLYNTYTANKEKVKSTGNAVRGSFTSLPMVAPTNFYIEPGQDSQATIIKSVNKGLYVTRLMGIHTANPISGEFSVGATGIMIEKGEKTFPVRGITIASNLLDLLRKVDGVASDLRFIPMMANIGSPTLLINDISVSGH